VNSGPELCVGAVAVFDDCLLLVRRATAPHTGRWTVPGGRVERGETLAEAVVRELREETGLDGLCGELLGWVERITDEFHFVIADFAVTVIDRTPPVAGDDAAEVAWVPIDGVTELDLVPGLPEFLADAGVIDLLT
jgi:8-oxo-dGTP diphosphatase